MTTSTTQAREWEETTLEEVATITRGASPRPIHDYLVPTGMPWVKIADATASRNRFISHTKECIKPEGVKHSVKVFSGDLIVSNSATPGVPKIMKLEACIHDGWLLFRDIKTDKYFLFYWLKNSLNKLVHSASGTVFKNLKTDIVKALDILVPPAVEQKEIAAVLSSLDDKIELLRKQNETLEQIARAIFHEWFVEFNFPNEKGEPYKASGGKMVDSELGEIPDGWKVVTTSDFADISIGRTPPRKQHEWFSLSPEDNKWISIKDLGEAGTFINKSTEYLTDEAIKNFKVPSIPEHIVIVSFKLTIGRVAITSEEMFSNEAIAHFKQRNQEEMSTEYIYLWLKNFNFGSLGSTSSIATATNSGAIRQIPFLVADDETMRGLQYLISPLFKKIKSNTKNLSSLSETRDALLPKLMNGEVRVKA